MTRTNILDIDLSDYLKPVKDHAPLGDSEFRYTNVFHEIQQNVSLGEELFTSDHPNYGEIYKAWEKVDLSCTTAIKIHKKDMLLLLYLVEAWFFIYEIDGLIMGIQLLNAFLTQFKDMLYEADQEWLELQMATLDFMDKKISQLILFFELTPSHDLMSAERITYYHYLSTRFYANKSFIKETDGKEKEVLNKKIETIELTYYQDRLEKVDGLLTAMDALDKTIDAHFDTYQIKFVDTVERVKKYHALIAHIIESKQPKDVAINEDVSLKAKNKDTLFDKKESSSILNLHGDVKTTEKIMSELLSKGINTLGELTNIMKEMKQRLDNI